LGLFKALVANPIIMWISVLCTLAYFIAMSVWPEMRKDAPLNWTYLMAGSIAMTVMYGSVSGRIANALAVSFMMAMTASMAGLYGGARFAKSSVNREYLIRKLITGVMTGFLVCIIVMVFAMSSFKFKGKEMTLILTMVFFLLMSLYFGYVVVFVVLPG
jgi:hypothetical protein